MPANRRRSGPVSDPEARIPTDKLVRELQLELRRRAHAARRRHYRGETMRTTVLIDEAYLHLVKGGDHRWENRGHFLGAASKAMRNVLITHLRERNAQKRNPGVPVESFDEELSVRDRVETEARREQARLEVIDFDRAYRALEQLWSRRAQVADLVLFAGAKMEDVARIVGISKRQAERDWEFARKFLQAHMRPPS
jgi:RNA polymerase sigma factor (TIGR02999 family)